MFLTKAKSARTLELRLCHFLRRACRGAFARLSGEPGGAFDLQPIPCARTRGSRATAGRLGAPALGRVPWRGQSLRVVITDLLYPVPPEDILSPLLHSTGRAIIFLPLEPRRAEPNWDGQLELRECETAERRLFQSSPARLERYRANYRRHFALWDEACRGRGVALARLSDEGSLMDALLKSALPAGAVELAQA